MTNADRILIVLDELGEVSANDMAERYRGSKSHWRYELMTMVESGRLNRRKVKHPTSNWCIVYYKTENATEVDLGGPMRSQMITKAWKPGELRLCHG